MAAAQRLLFPSQNARAGGGWSRGAEGREGGRSGGGQADHPELSQQGHTEEGQVVEDEADAVRLAQLEALRRHRHEGEDQAQPQGSGQDPDQEAVGLQLPERFWVAAGSWRGRSPPRAVPISLTFTTSWLLVICSRQPSPTPTRMSGAGSGRRSSTISPPAPGMGTAPSPFLPAPLRLPKPQAQEASASSQPPQGGTASSHPSLEQTPRDQP